MLTVRPVRGQSDWDAFRTVPAEVYRNDPWWIPDGTADLEALIIDPDPDAAARVQTQAYVAYESGTPVGRIVAIDDHRYNALHRERAAFFGFYEAVPRDAVGFALLDAAADWARQRSLSFLYGPLSPSVLHSAGMLVDGDGRRALVGMPYNPRYYPDQLTGWGMRKVTDLHSYRLPPPRRGWAGEQGSAGHWPPPGVTFRSMDMSRFGEEVELVRHIYNAAFVDFWGFTPAEPDEFRRLADGLRPIIDPELVTFVHIAGDPVGYLMAFPDVNQAPGGPTGHAGEPVRHARIDMLAVRPDHQDSWVGGMLIVEMLRRIYRKGYTTAEAAPILEDATWPRSMRASLSLERLYRVYGRDLGAA